MKLIDADKFLAYLIFSKHIDGLTCGEVKEAIEMCKVDILDKIRAEIEGNMESIIGKYDSSIPKFNMPSYKIERNKAREECISIIDKHISGKEIKQ